MDHSRLLIYGAYGYSGELVAREALARGLTPVLAGRDPERLAVLADELGLPGRAFDLEPDLISANLDDIDVVLHCAGPFSATAAPMVAACLATGTHYLDITGEISVFENVFALDARAREAGVVLCPGAGFDVVPTDCLAARLAEELPDATHLALGFDSRTGLSPGTAKTTVEGMADGGRIRRAGRIETVPLVADVRRIDFGAGEKSAATISWGDVSTAFHTTGIPDIAVYLPMSPRSIERTRRLNRVRRLVALPPVMALLKKRAGAVSGPDAGTRADRPAHVWGEVRNAAGTTKVGRVTVANGYTLTADASVGLAQHLLEHPPTEGGATTPSQLMGWQYVETLPGSGSIVITDD